MSAPEPIPDGLRNSLEHGLVDELPTDGDLRRKVRRALEAAYRQGYQDGHLCGSQETRYDLRAERDESR